MLLPYIRSSARKASSSPARSPSTRPASSTARLYAAPISARRQSGNRRRQPVPGSGRLEVPVVDAPREDPPRIGVERVEEPAVTAEVLVPKAGLSFDGRRRNGGDERERPVRGDLVP